MEASQLLDTPVELCYACGKFQESVDMATVAQPSSIILVLFELLVIEEPLPVGRETL